MLQKPCINAHTSLLGVLLECLGPQFAEVAGTVSLILFKCNPATKTLPTKYKERIQSEQDRLAQDSFLPLEVSEGTGSMKIIAFWVEQTYILCLQSNIHTWKEAQFYI